eukprot:1154227-Pelagomonas_calceolata.AAC.2
MGLQELMRRSSLRGEWKMGLQEFMRRSLLRGPAYARHIQSTHLVGATSRCVAVFKPLQELGAVLTTASRPEFSPH